MALSTYQRRRMIASGAIVPNASPAEIAKFAVRTNPPFTASLSSPVSRGERMLPIAVSPLLRLDQLMLSRASYLADLPTCESANEVLLSLELAQAEGLADSLIIAQTDSALLRYVAY